VTSLKLCDNGPIFHVIRFFFRVLISGFLVCFGLHCFKILNFGILESVVRPYLPGNGTLTPYFPQDFGLIDTIRSSTEIMSWYAREIFGGLAFVMAGVLLISFYSVFFLFLIGVQLIMIFAVPKVLVDASLPTVNVTTLIFPQLKGTTYFTAVLVTYITVPLVSVLVYIFWFLIFDILYLAKYRKISNSADPYLLRRTNSTLKSDKSPAILNLFDCCCFLTCTEGYGKSGILLFYYQYIVTSFVDLLFIIPSFLILSILPIIGIIIFGSFMTAFRAFKVFWIARAIGGKKINFKYLAFYFGHLPQMFLFGFIHFLIEFIPILGFYSVPSSILSAVFAMKEILLQDSTNPKKQPPKKKEKWEMKRPGDNDEDSDLEESDLEASASDLKSLKSLKNRRKSKDVQFTNEDSGSQISEAGSLFNLKKNRARKKKGRKWKKRKKGTIFPVDN